MQEEVIECRRDEDGKLRWYTTTRDGEELAGHDGTVLELCAEHFAEGIKIELSEPVPFD